MSTTEEQTELLSGSYILPTQYAIEAIDLGTGRFIVSSYFGGGGSIAYHLAKQMLTDLKDGSINEPGPWQKFYEEQE